MPGLTGWRAKLHFVYETNNKSWGRLTELHSKPGPIKENDHIFYMIRLLRDQRSFCSSGVILWDIFATLTGSAPMDWKIAFLQRVKSLPFGTTTSLLSDILLKMKRAQPDHRTKGQVFIWPRGTGKLLTVDIYLHGCIYCILWVDPLLAWSIIRSNTLIAFCILSEPFFFFLFLLQHEICKLTSHWSYQINSSRVKLQYLPQKCSIK